MTKHEFIKDFDEINFHDGGLTETEKKKFHTIYEKGDGSIHSDVLTDDQISLLGEEYNLIDTQDLNNAGDKLSPAYKLKITQLRSSNELKIILSDREKVYKRVGLEHLADNCMYITLCAEAGKNAYEATSGGTEEDKIHAAVTAIRELLKKNDANDDEVAMMQLYLKWNLGDQVVGSNASQTGRIDAVVGKDFFATTKVYLGEGMDIQHKGISTVIESSGELETSEEKALEYKNSVLEGFTMYTEYFKKITENVTGWDLIIDTDERYEAYLPMLDNAIAILQYDNGLTTESVQELIKKTMHANPMYTAMVLRSIKVKNPSVGRGQYQNPKQSSDAKIFTNHHKALVAVLCDSSIPANRRIEESMKCIRKMDVYDTNEALINLGTSRESSSTISNNSLNHVDAKIQKHGNENSKQTLSVMHDLLEDEERFEKMLFVCRGSGHPSIKKTYLTAFLNSEFGDTLGFNKAGLAEKIVDYMNSMNTPKQQQEMKESIRKDQAKQIERLEALECENKLNASGKEKLVSLIAMQDDDTLMDAYIQTVQHTTISLMIQHCINHAILESDRGIIDPDDAMMLRYADIQGVGRDLSDEGILQMQGTAQMLVGMLPIGMAAQLGARGALRVGGKVLQGVGRLSGVSARVALYANRAGLIGRTVSVVKNAATVVTEVAVGGTLHTAINTFFQDPEAGVAGLKKKMKLDGIVSDGVMLAILHGLSPVLKNFFDKTKGVSSITAKTGKFFVEEGLITLADMGSNMILGDGNYTPEQLLESFMMGAIFELGGHRFTSKPGGIFAPRDLLISKKIQLSTYAEQLDARIKEVNDLLESNNHSYQKTDLESIKTALETQQKRIKTHKEGGAHYINNDISLEVLLRNAGLEKDLHTIETTEKGKEFGITAMSDKQEEIIRQCHITGNGVLRETGQTMLSKRTIFFGEGGFDKGNPKHVAFFDELSRLGYLGKIKISLKNKSKPLSPLDILGENRLKNNFEIQGNQRVLRLNDVSETISEYRFDEEVYQNMIESGVRLADSSLGDIKSEFGGTMVGTIKTLQNGKKVIIVKKFFPGKSHKDGGNTINTRFDIGESMIPADDYAREHNMVVLGTYHTHPGMGANASSHDSFMGSYSQDHQLNLIYSFPNVGDSSMPYEMAVYSGDELISTSSMPTRQQMGKQPTTKKSKLKIKIEPEKDSTSPELKEIPGSDSLLLNYLIESEGIFDNHFLGQANQIPIEVDGEKGILSRAIGTDKIMYLAFTSNQGKRRPLIVQDFKTLSFKDRHLSEPQGLILEDYFEQLEPKKSGDTYYYPKRIVKINNEDMMLFSQGNNPEASKNMDDALGGNYIVPFDEGMQFLLQDGVEISKDIRRGNSNEHEVTIAPNGSDDVPLSMKERNVCSSLVQMDGEYGVVTRLEMGEAISNRDPMLGIVQDANEKYGGRNEDAMYYSLGDNTFTGVVVDGMGGVDGNGAFKAKHTAEVVGENFYNFAIDGDKSNINDYLESLNTGEGGGACFVGCTFKESESGNGYDLTMMHAGDATGTVVNNGNILYETVDHSQVSRLNQQGYINQNQTNVHPKANIVEGGLIEKVGGQGSRMHRGNLGIKSMQVTSGSVVFMASDGLTNLLRHNFSGIDNSREIIKELSIFQSVKEINDAIEGLLLAWKNKGVWTSSNGCMYDLRHQDNNEVGEGNTDFVPRYDPDNISFMVVKIP